MSKKVLLTGGAGFIGHLVIKKILENTDWEIVVIDRLSYASNLERINDVVNEVGGISENRVDFFYHDLKAELHEEIINKLSKTNIVIHIGASSHVTRSVQDPSTFIQDNIVGTFNLLEAARKFKNLDLFYYFSTDEVFGPSDDKAKFKEWDRYNSTNPYSATKSSAEELTIAYSNTYSLPSLISHCCNAYGERQHVEKFIPNSIKKILNDEEILIHTDGNNIPGSRYYIYNEDLADTILFLTINYEKVKKEAFKEQGKAPPKINITGDSLVSNLEVVEYISQILKKDFKYSLQSHDPSRPGHDIKYGLDNSLLQKIDGVFDRDFKDGIEQTVSWYCENQDWIN